MCPRAGSSPVFGAAGPGLRHFVQPLLLVLMEGPSPAPQNPVGCSREFLRGCWGPKTLLHLLTPPLKHAAPWCSSELLMPCRNLWFPAQFFTTLFFTPIFHPIPIPLSAWEPCLDLVLHTRTNPGNRSTSFPHYFRYCRLVGPDKCHPNCWQRVSDRFTACKVGPDHFYQRCFNNPKSAFQK